MLIRNSRLVVTVGTYLVAVWLIVGLVLRVTGMRDRYDRIALAYYTTPLAVLTVGFAVVALIAPWVRSLRVSLGAIAVICGLCWLGTSWKYSAPLDSTHGEVRLLLWNVRNNEGAIHEIAREIRRFSPDIVGLAEAGNHKSNVDRWTAEFPDYHVNRLPGQMLCMSRQPLVLEDQGPLGNGSWFAINTTEIGNRTVRILQTDINARPLRPRRPALENLTRKARALGAEPLILMGDFNTPRDSYYLDPLRTFLQHAFEARGNGYAETWPIPFPVLSLDQMWLSKHFEVVACDQSWSRHSDHRAVITIASFTE